MSLVIMLPMTKEIFELSKKNKDLYEKIVERPLAEAIGMKILKSKYCHVNFKELEDWEIEEGDHCSFVYRAVVDIGNSEDEL